MLPLESAKALKIRKIEIILEAIEFAQAKGKEKRSKISPEYKEKIEWNKGDDSNSVISFEIHIPKEIRRSYLGKYSEYYCLLEAKADIP